MLGSTMAATDAAPSVASGPANAGIPSVDWWITSRCNLNCDFCYGPAPAGDPVELRGAIFDALAASSAAVVTFCGGEPLLVKTVDQYAAAFQERSKATVLNTNGALLRRRVDQGFKLAFSMIGISIEGSSAEVHRAMRGPGADLDEALKAARIARERGVSVKIGTVVSQVNRHDLPSLARVIGELRPDIWRLYQYSSRGTQNLGQQRHALREEEFQRLADAATALASPVPTARSSESQTQGCLIVDPNGNVLQPVGSDYVLRGNCIQDSLDEIWNKIPSRSAIIANKRWLSILD
jgi:radical S-adenosyl methionine domain-containing protein 2